MSSPAIEAAYRLARQRYLEVGVDADAALNQLEKLAISLPCWQGDDVNGFEGRGNAVGGGLAVTGNYPGRARNGDELRADLEKALSLIPGRHRVNLHAIYAEPATKVERDELAPEHFRGWTDWAQAHGLGLDFNPTFFAHRLAERGATLTSDDHAVRQFWIDHGIACRRISAAFGQTLGSPCVTNFWVPDGMKDTPVDRWEPRFALIVALDRIFDERLDPAHHLDAVEAKLFGIGSESYVVGSHEFHLGYAITRRKMLCLDSGHFHPTESVADKLPAVLLYVDRMLLHVSRGVRWDSDHVVTLDDDLQALAQELVRNRFLDRVHLGLDYFDASINRIAAWVIGTRNLLKALLFALLEPIEVLRSAEKRGDYTSRLALLEEAKMLPFAAVWDFHCERSGVPIAERWLEEVKQHKRDVLDARS
jgi:L-rhamnose isomerase